MRVLKALVLAAGLAFAAGAPALAQQAGPIVVMDYERVVATSVAGRDIDAKLRAIHDQMQGELQPENAAIQSEAQSFQQATQGQTEDQVRRNAALQQRGQALQQRIEAQRNQQLTRSRDLEYTRQQALVEFGRLAQPIVREVMNNRHAVAVVDRSAVQLMVDSVDVTADIISRLDQQVRTVNVTRQVAPQPPAQPGR
jgi:Skp family chaperone for outer membrane proteins